VSTRAYSERLLQHAGTGVVDWYVPAGYRAVLRCINAVNRSSSGGTILVYGAAAYLYYCAIPGASSISPVDLRVVLYAGERLAIDVAGPQVDVTLTGYVFSDPTGAKGPPLGAVTLPAPLPLPPFGEDLQGLRTDESKPKSSHSRLKPHTDADSIRTVT
jgi:hypothetical protein